MAWPLLWRVLASASLRTRLVALVLLSTLPLVGLLFAGAVVARDDVVAATRLRAVELARLGAEQQEDALNDAKTLLSVVARTSLTAGTPASCQKLLQLLVDDHPHISDLALVGPDGQSVCNNKDASVRIDVSDRPYIQRLLAPGAQGFDMSDPVMSRSTRVPAIFVGLALAPEPGSDRPAGILVAGIRLSWLSGLAAKIVHDRSNIAVVLDTISGATLARYPDNGAWTGYVYPDGPVVAAARQTPGQAGTGDGIGPDGIDRIFGYAPLPGGHGRTVVAIGFARDLVLAQANRRMALVLSLALAAMAAAVAVAWLSAWATLIKPVETIIATASRLGTGDLAARAVLRRWHAPELRVLAGRLNAMARDIDSGLLKLTDSQARYRLLAEHSSDLIVLRFTSGAQAYVSPASRTMVGYEPQELAALPADQYIHPDDLDRVLAGYTSLTVGGPRYIDVYRVRHKAGHLVWVETVFHLVKPGTPEEGVVITSRDITDRRRLEIDREGREAALQRSNAELDRSNAELERLALDLAGARDHAERASRAKSRFLAGMSHELRTPLNGILGYTHLLRLDDSLTAVQTARLDAMLGAGTHLLRMINSVLDLSQIEAEQIDLQNTAIDLRAITAECAECMLPAAEAKRLALTVTVAADVPDRVMADATRLRQVLLNLLGNAVKFTPDGSIALRAVAAGTTLRITVADTGPGIPADRRPRLFHEFERLGNQPGAGIEGAGFGLALSARLIALMGGQIGYDDNPGGGSLFWLEIPLLPCTVDAPPTPAASPDPAATRKLRILVVDDIAMNRDIAGSFLRAARHEVTCVDGGAAAIEAVAALDYDVVLMDVRMPEMDGLEATRRIRALGGARGAVPIVALTAQVFAEQVAECRRAGMDSHLTKPFAPEALLAAVASAASGRAPAAPPEPADCDAVVCNDAAFERAVAYLPGEAVASYLRTLVAGSQALLRGLREQDAPSAKPALAAAAHSLAGSAGLFGFERLAAAARDYERAAEADTQETPAAADTLIAVIDTTLLEMHSRQPAPAEA